MSMPQWLDRALSALLVARAAALAPPAQAQNNGHVRRR
jgi:hypothetical protein